MSDTVKITRHEVAENARLGFLHSQLNASCLRFEMTVYSLADRFSADYGGGFWRFYKLQPNGFYIAPESDASFKIINEMNYFEGELSADAFGIALCLFALSHMSFADNAPQILAERFHQLREFALDHAEASAIFSFLD
jgi:hypothetical protein